MSIDTAHRLRRLADTLAGWRELWRDFTGESLTTTTSNAMSVSIPTTRR